MAQTDNAILGIDIGADQVRIVETRIHGSNVRVVSAGAAPLPEGSVQAGRVVDPDAVGRAVMDLTTAIGARARRAVMGISQSHVTARVLEVPSVGDADLPMIVEGEVLHFKILPEEGGGFDFMRLPSTGARKATDLVLLMAVDEQTLSGTTRAVGSTRLELARNEPSHVALLRIASERMSRDQSTVALLVTDLRAELAILDKGQVVLYRRLDYGGSDLVGAGGHGLAAGDRKSSQDLNLQVAGNFSTEIQRSVEYFRREISPNGNIRNVVLATTEPAVVPFADWLARELSLDVELASPSEDLAANERARAELALPGGVQYTCAFGLAMGGTQAVPAFDIRSRLRPSPELTSAKRYFAISSAVTAAIVVAGAFGFLHFGKVSETLRADTERLNARIQELNRIQRPQLEAKVAEMARLRQLAREGVLMPRIMDAVAAALDSGAGLLEVGMDPAWNLTLVGEAQSELSMIATLDHLRMYPFFSDAMVESFERMPNAIPETSIRFKMSARHTGYYGAPAALDSGGAL